MNEFLEFKAKYQEWLYSTQTYEHTKGREITKDISSGRRGTKGQSNYEWIKRDTGFSVMQALPSTHDRNEYLLNEIPPPRSPSPGRTNAQPKCPLQHCTHSVRPAHKRPPSRQREMVILLCKDKKTSLSKKHKISLYGQYVINPFF